MKSILLSNKNFKDINPMECGTEHCSITFQRLSASRQYYLIHFIFSGKGKFVTKNSEYNVSKGQIFIMHPFEVVNYCADPKDPWYYCWVGFELFFDAPTLNNNSVMDIPQAEHIFYALKNSDNIGLQKELYICGKIFEILSIIERSDISNKNKSDEYVDKAKQYIEVNYMHPITVVQIAKYLNIDRSYFSTIFKKRLGKSPQQYLVDVRLENAANLITNYDYSITDAALSSGYTDIFNFSKMFKRKFGVSPKVYSITHKNNPE